MKSLLFVVIGVCLMISVDAQILPLTTEPVGGNKKAAVSEQIGIVKIEINYGRPRVKGREGKIYNTPVAHYGFIDQGHGTSTAAPWRAGANENTTMSFSHPVKIEGKNLPAGKYGFFISLGDEESTLIFSTISNSWGSFYYDSAADALRVTVKNIPLEKTVEWLTYAFVDQTDSTANIAFSWEKRMISFKVEAEVKELQIASFENEFRTTRPYNDYIQAADYCIQHNIALEKALAWMDHAIAFRVMGQKNFSTLSTKAAVLMKMNRVDEAKKVMEEALPLGTMTDVHFYGRQLLSIKQVDEAMKIYKMNYRKYPNQFTTNVGLGRAFSAKGDFRKALTYMNAALPQAPDELNKNSVISMLQRLHDNKDVN